VNQKSLHRAWRYIIYIRELGGEPISYQHRNHRAYAAELEHQYTRLCRAATAIEVKTAKARAIGLIRRKGLMRAAGLQDPTQIAPLTVTPTPVAAFPSNKGCLKLLTSRGRTRSRRATCSDNGPEFCSRRILG
jgi:hypothetical protein